MTKKEIQEQFLSITNVPEIVDEYDNITLLTIQKEITNIKKRLDLNPSFVFPSITTLTNGVISSSDFINGKKGEAIYKKIMELRRENCYNNIDNATKLIKNTLSKRKRKVKKQTCKLSAVELAQISTEFGLNKFLSKTEIVRLIFMLREEKLGSEVKNTYLYRNL